MLITSLGKYSSLLVNKKVAAAAFFRPLLPLQLLFILEVILIMDKNFTECCHFDRSEAIS